MKAAKARTYRLVQRGRVAEKMWVVVPMVFKLPD